MCTHNISTTSYDDYCSGVELSTVTKSRRLLPTSIGVAGSLLQPLVADTISSTIDPRYQRDTFESKAIPELFGRRVALHNRSQRLFERGPIYPGPNTFFSLFFFRIPTLAGAIVAESESLSPTKLDSG
jgi:hypothetical protein